MRDANNQKKNAQLKTIEKLVRVTFQKVTTQYTQATNSHFCHKHPLLPQ